ncbi:Rab family GTPase [Histomonas meleagridis]|uniref:Rab family GTPase n=1 Tax=Histomonas meleagridis TaxID=135588 RepID=UPI00355A7BBC|nr:Rab family GTPase [Histomonas meleagridis]KAH0806776.1 Rab family GTPase [Histomonas meleagridis]
MTNSLSISDLPAPGKYHQFHPEYTSETLSSFSCPRPISMKLIFLGDVAVGKTCLVNRIVKGTYNESYKQTVGAQFLPIQTQINGNDIKVQVWDTSGQDDYFTVVRAYFRGANFAFLCFDLSRPETFDNLEKWYQRAIENASEIKFFFLVGCKSDLPQKVEETQINEFAKKNQMEYFSVSSKSNVGTAELIKRGCFLTAVSIGSNIKVPKTVTVQAKEQNETPQTVDITHSENSKKKGCCN